MKIFKPLFFVSFFLAFITGFAQRPTVNHSQLWYGYFLTLQFNKKWYAQTELQERHFINPTAQHQFLIRSHLHRSFESSGWESSAGMAIFRHHPNDPEAPVKLGVPEVRPHVEVAYKQRLKKVIVDHRYRAETRFFQNTNEERTELKKGFDFNSFRFRYRLQVTLPMWKIDDARALKIYVGDEILFNAGKKITTNTFDQNRIYAGLTMDVSKSFILDVGYLNWFQQSATGTYYNRDIVRFSILQKVYLKRDELNYKGAY